MKKRQLILKKLLGYAITEAKVLKMSKDHPFILDMHYAFQVIFFYLIFKYYIEKKTPQYLYLVLDYCPGGDLSLQIIDRGVFDEETTRFYMAELLLSLEYLHDQNIVYRDLKPENILLS